MYKVKLSVTISGNTATITGVQEDDVVQYTTTDDHNRVLIRNDQPVKGAGSNVAFDLGGFTITQIASDVEEVGSKVHFEDDGPAIDLTSLEPTIAVDESVGTGGSSKDEPGNAQPDDETAAGAPAGAIGYAVTAAATLFSETADAGSDGEDGTVYSLVLNAGATGLTDTATGEAVVLSLVGGIVEGRTATSDDLVFTIAVDSTSGDVTTALYRALDHGADLNDHDSAVSMASGLVELQATLTDGDTDTASDKIELGSLIDFEDDGPDVVVDDTSVNSSDTTATYGTGAQGDWSDDPGSDGSGSLNVTFDSYQINAHGSVDTNAGNSTFTKGVDDFHYSGSITDDFNSDGIDDTVSFTLTFDPDNDSYALAFTTPPETTTTFSTDEGSIPAGGPDAVQTLVVGDVNIVFSAVVPTTPPADIKPFLNATEAFIEANAEYLSDDEMNVSTSGIGNDNNNFDGNANAGIDGATTQGGKVDESFVVDPDILVSSMKVYIDNSVGGYNLATEQLYYLVYDADGNTVGDPILVTASDLTAEAGGQVSFVVGDPNGPNEINAVQLFMGTGTIKIPTIEFTTSQAFDPESLDLDFTATLFDGDGDSSEDMFSAHVEPDATV